MRISHGPEKRGRWTQPWARFGIFERAAQGSREKGCVRFEKTMDLVQGKKVRISYGPEKRGRWTTFPIQPWARFGIFERAAQGSREKGCVRFEKTWALCNKKTSALAVVPKNEDVGQRPKPNLVEDSSN